MSISVSFEGRIGQISEIKGEDKSRYIKLGVVTSKYVGEGKGDVYHDKASAYRSSWINVTAFGSQAQFLADKFSKGDTIVIIGGELDISTYPKKDAAGKVIDEKATSVNVIARDFSGPYSRANKTEVETAPQVQSGKSDKSSGYTSYNNDDIPF